MDSTMVNPLGTERISKLMVSYAVPSVISLTVNALYNLVDQVFIGQGIGYLGNAATNVIMPLTTIAMAIGQLLGSGCVPYISLSMGRGKYKDANEGVGTVVTTTLIAGVVMMVLFELLMTPLCYLFGATEESISYAMDYGRIIVLGFPFFLSGFVFTFIFRTDGRPNVSLIGMLIGFFTNIILDPIFIFVLGWGVKGAAWATILGQIFNAVYFFWEFPRCKTLHLEKSHFFIRARHLRTIMFMGLSGFATQIETVLVQFAGNNLLVHYGALSRYGADIPMAAYGITIKLMLLVSNVASGIIIGMQPILGYNYGSRQYDRVKKTFRFSILSSTIILMVAWCVFEFAPEATVSLFGQESALYQEFAVKSLRIFMALCPLLGFCIITPVFLQSLGRPISATVLTILRELVFLILSMIVMARLIGVEGILFAGPISQLLTSIVGSITLAYLWKKLFGGAENG